MSNESGYGSLYSTAGDLLRWQQAWQRSPVLTAASWRAMFTDYGHGYGFGISIHDQLGHKIVGHDGVVPGFGAFIRLFPDDSVAIVFASNVESGLVLELEDHLADLFLNGKSVPSAVRSPAAAVPVSSSSLLRWVLSGRARIRSRRGGDRRHPLPSRRPRRVVVRDDATLRDALHVPPPLRTGDIHVRCRWTRHGADLGECHGRIHVQESRVKRPRATWLFFAIACGGLTPYALGRVFPPVPDNPVSSWVDVAALVMVTVIVVRLVAPQLLARPRGERDLLMTL